MSERTDTEHAVDHDEAHVVWYRNCIDNISVVQCKLGGNVLIQNANNTFTLAVMSPKDAKAVANNLHRAADESLRDDDSVIVSRTSGRTSTEAQR